MALTSATVWEARDTATTGNVNGAGFNPLNASFLTDLATDTNTANTASPVVSSASYNFVAGDVNAYVYVRSGTNWQAGWYQIASVATNKATLSAAIGAVVTTIDSRGTVTRNTAVGCTSNNTATLTAGTFGVDYSQQDTAKTTATDFASTGSSTTLTSATAAFTPVMVGNIFHQTTTGTGAFGITGWYEIVSYTNATTVVLDRTPNSGTASVACTGFVGGAARYNALEDAFFEMVPAASIVFIKNGTYTTSAAISISSTNSTVTQPSFIMGYNALRGDSCTGSNRPTFAMGANACTMGQYQNCFNLIVTGTNSSLFTCGVNSMVMNCKIFNSSSTAGRVASNVTNVGSFVGNETIAQNGVCIQDDASGMRLISGNYIHDCVTGVTGSFASVAIINNIFEACSTNSITSTSTSGNQNIYGNTIYGIESKTGTGINLSGANSPANRIINNILYGLTTGISIGTSTTNSNFSTQNDFFNNTTDVTNFVKSPTDLALDPQFVGASQLTGTTATTSGSVLTDSGANFSSVTDNVDFVRVVSGTGTTLGNYLITSHTTTTLTVNNALGTGGTADKVYYVTVGHNFQIGTNLKAAGFPNFTGSGSETTSYPDVGAVQRQETGGGGSGGSFTFVG